MHIVADIILLSFINIKRFPLCAPLRSPENSWAKEFSLDERVHTWLFES